MTRYIAADEIRWADHYDSDGNLSKYKVAYSDEMPPAVDAVPSEMLYDFIRGIGATTYGKERFFYEDVGVWRDLWYDRKSGEWITTQTAIEECLKAVRELDDCDIDAVQHGKWIDIDEQAYTWKVRCSCCGYERSMMSTQGKYPNYCEACGARMDEK